MSLPLFALLALLAEILGTVGGFGSSVFFVPLASLFFDFKTVLGVTAIFHIFSNASKLALFYKHIDRKLVLQLAIPGVVMVLLGAWLTTKVSFTYSELILGIFLFCFGGFMLLKNEIALARSMANSIVGGGLAGFLAGFVGTGGAVRGAVMSAYNLDKSLFVGTSAAVDMAVDVSRAIVYSTNGYVSKANFVLIAILFFVSFAGSWLGKKILEKVPQRHFRKIVLAQITLVGIVMIYRGIAELL